MLQLEKQFIGRNAEISKLLSLLGDTKTLYMYGDPGIGKTAFANALYEHPLLSHRFQKKIRQSAFIPKTTQKLNNGLSGKSEFNQSIDGFLFSLASNILKEVSLNATRQELETQILNHASSTSILLLLDNLEVVDQNWIQNFILQWQKTSSESFLIITTTKPFQKSFEIPDRLIPYQVNGFADDEKDAIIKILGPELKNNIEEVKLLKASRKLSNSPQKLLYLRWLNPSNESALFDIVEGILNQSENVIKGISEKVDGPLTHFFAIGRIRTIEIEEQIIAWLWDCLELGRSFHFLNVRDQLVNEGILQKIEYEHSNLYRINPGIHIQLEKYLEQNMGRQHIAHIDYYLSEYYRKLFIRKTTTNLPILERFVYHAIQAGNIIGALDYVLDPNMLNKLHKQGHALSLRIVLSIFESSIEAILDDANSDINLNKKIESDKQKYPNKLGSLKENTELLPYYARIKIEVAHCQKDLSNHTECLAYLDEAEYIVNLLSDEQLIFNLCQAINYFRGISYSSLGNSEECKKAYALVVMNGIEHKRFADREILALGYLAFECRFYEIHRAKSLGLEAVRIAENYGNLSLIAKNNCSLGQTYLFDKRIDEALICFNKAEKISSAKKKGSSDRRELGRILINKAIVAINQQQYTPALKLLDEAEKINTNTGDRRRSTTAKLFRGIAVWRGGDVAKGTKLLEQAISQHFYLKDWRNLVNAILSYAYIINFRSQNEAYLASQKEKYQNDLWAKALKESKENGTLELYGNYWTSFFRPIVLE